MTIQAHHNGNGAAGDQRFVDAIIAVLDERGPDYIYPGVTVENDSVAEGSCAYSEDEGKTGSCLLGVVVIERLNFEWDNDWEGTTIQGVLRRIDLPVSPQVTEAAFVAQELQDTRRNYGHVRARFIARIEASAPWIVPTWDKKEQS